MTQTLTENATSLRELDPQASAKALAAASAARAPVWLQAGADDVRMTWCGAMTGVDGSNLTLEVYNLDSGLRAVLGSSILQATVVIDGTACLFDTRCKGEIPSAQSGVLRVARPLSILVVDRRRSPRRCLRQRCDVALHGTGPSSDWRCLAAMLNLSPDGVACRLPERDAQPVELGEILRLDFRPGGEVEKFRLRGRVVSMTPGGTPEHVLLGMQFIDDDYLESAKARLLAVLEGPE